jgi:hypothetical protein
MERSAASTSTIARGLAASGSSEPGHLHFDRATRRWLAHAAGGTLQPYSSAETLRYAIDATERGMRVNT